jgi:hypothetical protein
MKVWANLNWILFVLFVCAAASSTTAQVRKNPKVPPPQPRVASIRLYPERIRLGETARLVVRLDRVAPKGGTTVGIGEISDGTGETLKQTPTAFTFLAGSQKVEYLIRTSIVENAAKKIIFCASTLSPVDCYNQGIKSVTLVLLP